MCRIYFDKDESSLILVFFLKRLIVVIKFLTQVERSTSIDSYAPSFLFITL